MIESKGSGRPGSMLVCMIHANPARLTYINVLIGVLIVALFDELLIEL